MYSYVCANSICICSQQFDSHHSIMVKFCILDFCDEPRNTFIMHVILGVCTFGISIMVWYIYVKCKDNDKGISCVSKLMH